MEAKRRQNGAKSSSRGVSEASWKRPGIVFCLLDPLGRVWARFWRRPEAQDGLLAASWRNFGGQDGAKTEPKSIKNRKQKSIIFLMPLEIGFWVDFDRFWSQNGAKLASKMEQKSIPTSKSYFSKKPGFPLGIRMIRRPRQGKVGTKNQSKIDVKTIWTRRDVFGAIFNEICSIFGANLSQKIDQKPI